MQTTSRAAEAMGGLYGDGGLEAALADARRRTLQLYAHLDLASLEVPKLSIVNPPVWELSHIAWFQEHWCLREGRRERATLLPDADSFFDSSAIPHDTRWSLPYPPWARLRQYMDDTLDATLARLAKTPDDARYFFELALLHEDMHGEALAMTLQTLGLPAPAFAAAPSKSVSVPCVDIAFEAGELLQGTARGARRFAFDNEKWAHPVRVGRFAMASEPVTQGEFRAFVEDGGYEQERWWTPESWRWRVQGVRAAPRDWARDGAAWRVRRFDRDAVLDDAAPMLHVAQHEALAWCRWAKRRLPTETEWEYAATNGGRDDPYPWGADERALANLDMRHAGPSIEASDPMSRRGMRRMIGGAWEWTASAFAPYPGFAPDPYRDYSEPWFHTHAVLRGGSFATRARLVHNRFRNFYVASRDDVFAGFRTCAP
ncbi:MAG TPA: selenoneine synthase SenA [Usitatibacter sp.]|nr:selenoneine synthase SenA [Usitatibacter sp.]